LDSHTQLEKHTRQSTTLRRCCILSFQGYRRLDESVGIRNHVLVIPTVVCASEIALKIASRVKGTVTFTHQHGCAQIGQDLERTFDTLVRIACNPNVAATLAVSLGCESVDTERFIKQIERTRKPVVMLGIQDEHGSRRTVEKGIAIARKMVENAAIMKRKQCDLSELVVGLECGASDATSGIAANPALGVASEMIIKQGGTTILSETTELIGAEHLVAKRSATPHVKKRIYEIVRRMQKKIETMGVDSIGGQPTPGNLRGGITTIEEKSLGCVHKAGNAQIQEVLEYGEKPRKKGLIIMDTPGHDVESITGMIAGGAQLIAFTTGLGTPVGSAIAPVLKITGNPRTYRTMKEDMDINAGTIIEGKEAIECVGIKIYDEIIRVASGKRTKAERHGYHEFAINRIGPSL